jgi:hypothetical protein
VLHHSVGRDGEEPSLSGIDVAPPLQSVDLTQEIRQDLRHETDAQPLLSKHLDQAAVFKLAHDSRVDLMPVKPPIQEPTDGRVGGG